MVGFTKLRAIFYGHALAFSIIQFVFGIWLIIMDEFSDKMLGMGSAVTGFSVLCFIWIIVLLIFHNRPQSKNLLVQTSIHFYSFVFIGVTAIALVIALATQVPAACDFETYSDGLAGLWCVEATFTISFLGLTAIFSGIIVFLVYRHLNRVGADMGSNIAHLSKDGEVPLK